MDNSSPEPSPYAFELSTPKLFSAHQKNPHNVGEMFQLFVVGHGDGLTRDLPKLLGPEDKNPCLPRWVGHRRGRYRCRR